MDVKFELGLWVGNSKWTGKIVHISPHTISVEVIEQNGEIKIYKRKRKQLKICKYFNEFKIGDRCYVFDWYHNISNYDCVLFPSDNSLKEAVVIDTDNYIISIRLLNNDNSHRYKQVYASENEIKTSLIHRNKFLRDLDIGRYGRIKIDQILDNLNIKIINMYDSKGYTSKSWILALNKKNNMVCCLTHYDCDIENCKYKSKNNTYLVSFSKLDEFEYCSDTGCVSDSIENRKHYEKICSHIYSKYINQNLIKEQTIPTAFVIKVSV